MRKAFMIAATGSNCGKTTITCGLLKAFQQKNYRLGSYKCGPDYIDPMFHAQILGVPCKNLDLFFTGEEQTKDLFLQDNNKDLSIVEGVMGLYDGIAGGDQASSYHLAKALGLPVILTVNAKGMGYSLLALIKGFLSMDTSHRIKAVILNRISKGYYEKIAPLIEQELGIKVAGYLPEQKGKTLESRYLGLKLPQEIADLKELTEHLGQQVAKTIDLDLLEQLALPLPEEQKETTVHATKKAPSVKIAIARDEAFCFYYEDNLRMLREAGAHLVPFSPLHDQSLPEDCKGLILGGGYPELFAETLSQNTSMLQSIRSAIKRGLPSIAECGGFMYLHHSIIKEDGGAYPMCDVLPGDCFNTTRLTRFGYVSIAEKEPAFLPPDTSIRGHEFHYYDSSENGSDAISVKPLTDKSWESSFIGKNHWWGFAHLYYPSSPAFPKNFVQRCQEI